MRSLEAMRPQRLFDRTSDGRLSGPQHLVSIVGAGLWIVLCIALLDRGNLPEGGLADVALIAAAGVAAAGSGPVERLLRRRIGSAPVPIGVLQHVVFGGGLVFAVWQADRGVAVPATALLLSMIVVDGVAVSVLRAVAAAVALLAPIALHAKVTLLSSGRATWVTGQDELLRVGSFVALIGMVWGYSNALAGERERAADAARAERRRLARELHDVVAHELTVVAVQAGGARAVLDVDPARADVALDNIEVSVRRGLGELRSLLTLLNDEAARAPREPTEALRARLEVLVSAVRAAGPAVVLDVEPTAERHVTAATGDVVVKVVQEALTNALRHAGPGTTIEVTVHEDLGELQVRVIDTGGDGGTANQYGAGKGIDGMRSRISEIGGDLAAGAEASGWAVSARIPVDGPGSPV